MFGRKAPERKPYDWDTAPQPELAPFFAGQNSVPAPQPVIQRSGMREDLKKIISANVRTKPSYADCWLVGNVGKIDVLEEYDTPSGHVAIGTAADGEYEYNLTPLEYTSSESLNSIITEIIEAVKKEFRTNGGRSDRFFVDRLTRDLLADHEDTLGLSCGGNAAMLEKTISGISDIVYRYTVGLGIFDVLLSDPRLEDLYLDAPANSNRIHVTLSGIKGSNAHCSCRTNLVVDMKEVQNLICHLKKESGLPFSESNPVLETDMKEYDARATIVGYPMSPKGDAVAIRKHSKTPWTLTRLVANGTLDPNTAAKLSFLVQNHATFLVCGARGAGKSSLLSAMMFEFPLSQRILSLEDTLELPGEAMRKMGYKVQSILMDDRMDGDAVSRSNEAMRLSLRLGESALVIGEIRGTEAKTLYECMRTGRAGSSIMGTIHGDSAKTVFERVVHDMGISPESFMATEVVITMGTVLDRKTGAQTRKVSEFVVTSDRVGEFIDISGDIDYNAPVMRRALSVSGMSVEEAAAEIDARSRIREFLAEMGKKHGETYWGAEWVSASNEYIMRNSGKDSDSIFNGFKNKFITETGLTE